MRPVRPVRSFLATLTDEQLAGRTEPPVGPGWTPEGETFLVKECLDVLLNEEWWHRQFAERDLTTRERGSRRTRAPGIPRRSQDRSAYRKR